METDKAEKNYTKSRHGEECYDQVTIELMQLHNCNISILSYQKIEFCPSDHATCAYYYYHLL